jgi:hypothetical protein
MNSERKTDQEHTYLVMPDDDAIDVLHIMFTATTFRIVHSERNVDKYNERERTPLTNEVDRMKPDIVALADTADRPVNVTLDSSA